MSNKIVPAIYRAVIDEVIEAIKPEFEEFGVSEDVLAELQHKWENKVIASRVADFEAPHPPPQHHGYPHPMHMMSHPHYPHPYAALPHHPGQPPHIKTEPLDNRYVLTPPGVSPYTLPALPGPQLNGVRPHPGVPPRLYPPPYPAQPSPQQLPPPRIPQVDGPSSSSSDSPSPPSSQSHAPHSSHPSLPKPPLPSSPGQPDDPEAINSDLDDSDTENEEEAEEGAVGENDIVFCTYDKVARVKNKWKCILKDGMIHVNGRDYLFSKCTGEFEW